jgi:hypothetical protein
MKSRPTAHSVYPDERARQSPWKTNNYLIGDLRAGESSVYPIASIAIEVVEKYPVWVLVSKVECPFDNGLKRPRSINDDYVGT